MFNNRSFDEIMRVLRVLKLEFGSDLNVCAVDEESLGADSLEDGPKYRKMRALPRVIQQMIERISGSTISALAKTDDIWDREATMGTSIAQCGEHGKTLAFVGLVHAMDLSRIGQAISWANAIQYTALLLGTERVSSLALSQGYPDESERFPGFKKACLDATAALTPQAVSARSIDPKLNDCFTVSSGAESFSYTSLFDAFVIGPPGTKISD